MNNIDNIKKLHELFLKTKQKISTDTRDITKESIFFAWRGENENGNKYAEEALKKGASYVVVDDEKFYKKDDKRYIFVENSMETLIELAYFHRNQFNIPILAITGSNGKTTTKELIASVLNTEKEIIYTEGNLNNHIGVPKTLLKINKKTEIAIIEMGANHIGEIERLCKIAKPTHGIITNIGRAHLGLFGGYDGVIRAKSELYRFLENNGGTSFINGNDSLLLRLSNTDEKITYFSEDSDYPVYSKKTLPFVSLIWKRMNINSNLTGEYNTINISASIAVGSYFKISDENIKKGIENYIPKNSRSEIIKVKDENYVIKDFYNANGSSVELALKNLSEIETNKEKVAILGDMFELGEFAYDEHNKILETALSLGIDKIYLVGEIFYSLNYESKKTEKILKVFKNTDNIISSLQKEPIKNSFILLKASNGMNFKKLFKKLSL
jgi:UDP-N-acetylmuramoyl-tripeptide--D-alanyl-D-alanine ligase